MHRSQSSRLLRGAGAALIALAAASLALAGPTASSNPSNGFRLTSRDVRREDRRADRREDRREDRQQDRREDRRQDRREDRQEDRRADRRSAQDSRAANSTSPDHHSGSGGGQTSVMLAPFDFSDAYLRANGIEPTRLVGRPTGTGPNSTISPAPDANHRNIRMLDHSATWDHSGKPWFFTVHGIIFPNTFTNDAAGVQARQIAESYLLYDFPRAANAQFATFPKRQEAISDMRNGYFSNNPLGIWKIMHVRYTPAAFTPAGQQRLAELAARNGTDLDGTPLVKTLSELDDLRGRGLVSVTAIPTDGSAGPPWFMCPVLKDPRNGAIAADAHFTQTVRANGQPNPGEAIFKTTFDSLQRTGRFP